MKRIKSVKAEVLTIPKTATKPLQNAGAEAIIPVRKNAAPWKENKSGAKALNEILRATERFGRTLWKQWSGYRLSSPQLGRD